MAATLFLPACTALAACNYIDDFSNLGLAQCEAYAKETLKSPSSYKRASFVVVDTPVSKELLAEAMGGGSVFKAVADIAPNPGIRGIALDFDSDNGFGAQVRDKSACLFPMSDIANGDPASDWDSLSRSAASRFRMAVLTGDEKFDEVCCLAPSFDTMKIHQAEAE